MEEAKNSNGIFRKDEQVLLVAVCKNAPIDVVNSSISSSSIKVQDTSGNTALHVAVREKRWDLVPVLVQHGADVNMGNDCQETPLHLAVEHDAPVDIIPPLISPHNINMKEDDRYWELQGLVSPSGNTALHLVVRKKRWELVPVLLRHGADVNITNDRQETALYLAVEHDAPADIIASLISPHIINLQDVSTFHGMQDEDGDEDDGNTVLHRAMDRERWDLVLVLLQHGADVNMRCCDYCTPLHLAALYGAPVDVTIQLISSQNINMEDNDGYTALHNTVQEEEWHLVPVLLQYGADPFIHGILPEPPRPLSLQSLTIATIRSHMPVKSDEAFERLGLPHILPELKLKPLADEIVAIKRKEDVK